MQDIWDYSAIAFLWIVVAFANIAMKKIYKESAKWYHLYSVLIAIFITAFAILYKHIVK